jgi:hypothetical protein
MLNPLLQGLQQIVQIISIFKNYFLVVWNFLWGDFEEYWYKSISISILSKVENIDKLLLKQYSLFQTNFSSAWFVL